ncbi:MAG TPA: AraC family transcriptional regulator [bacterium]|nr:AraC family transcriptional regulator [bacterium]
MNEMAVDLRTSDLDEIREAVEGLFCPFSLRPRAKKYEAQLHHRRLGELSFTNISYDQPIDIEVPPQLPAFLIQFPLRGTFQARTEGANHLISTELAHLIPPGKPLKLHCPVATDFLVIAMDPSEVAGSSKVPDTLALTGAGASLAHCLRFLQAEAFRLDTSPVGEKAAGHAKRMLGSLLLDLLHGDPYLTPPSPWYIKRAEEFMEANLDGDIGIQEISAGASIGIRTLYYGFQKAHGISPMAWLKQRRLDRVRAELLAAHPAETTVTDVALRWGFFHLGRLASDYRARFGELPSETLQRR